MGRQVYSRIRQQQKTRQYGAISIFTIAILSLMAVITISISVFSCQILLLLSAEQHSSLARRDANNNAVKSGSGPQSGLQCRSYTAKRGRQEIKRDICVINFDTLFANTGNSNRNSPLAAINYNKLFSDFSYCRNLQSISGSRTLSGRQLSPSSDYSLNTCRSVQQVSNGKLRLASNLELDRLQFQRQNGNSNEPLAYNLIAVAGYLQIAEELTISRDTLVIATSDLIISSIKTDQEDSLALTLVSASGRIEIDQVSPLIQLNAFAKGTIVTPLQSIQQTKQPLPPLLERMTLGLFVLE